METRRSEGPTVFEACRAGGRYLARVATAHPAPSPSRRRAREFALEPLRRYSGAAPRVPGCYGAHEALSLGAQGEGWVRVAWPWKRGSRGPTVFRGRAGPGALGLSGWGDGRAFRSMRRSLQPAPRASSPLPGRAGRGLGEGRLAMETRQSERIGRFFGACRDWRASWPAWPPSPCTLSLPPEGEGVRTEWLERYSGAAPHVPGCDGAHQALSLGAQGEGWVRVAWRGTRPRPPALRRRPDCLRRHGLLDFPADPIEAHGEVEDVEGKAEDAAEDDVVVG